MKTPLIYAALFALLLPANALAGNGCKKFIGDLTTGTVVASRGRYECFSSAKKAARAGFTDPTGTIGIPAPLVFSGTSAQDTTPFSVDHRPFTVHITSGGIRGYCGVILRRAKDGEWLDLLVNEIGVVDTSQRVNDKGPYYLEVDCGRRWSIDIH